ncbi:polysaccharide lyase [Bosea sp. BH3]|uniref:polysaccharide lyase n=1 Tax=Bosea sp. BH3 TaxID=2871701 RepID=UPI0021CAE559|nr:polysaccharide lyase [Bosea sp. BH3]MCU4181132.1 polysaccharide lyase [Bosea sp. BH3]
MAALPERFGILLALLTGFLLGQPANAESPSPLITELTVTGGQRFTLIGPRHPWNAVRTSLDGEAGWIAMECRENERRPGAGMDAGVDRVGFDGFAHPIAAPAVRIRFSVVPGENSFATGPGDWLNFFEMHAHKAAGDVVENSGPLLFTWEWSYGAKRPEFRIIRQYLTANPPQDLGSYKRDNLYRSTTAMQIGKRYDFTVEMRFDPTAAGYVRVTMNGNPIVNYAGPFGYGPERIPYPQFRLYRNARTTTSKALFRIVEIRSGATAADIARDTSP